MHEGKVVIAVDLSTNKKTGLASATYAPFQTCSNKCPMRRVCYAKSGSCGFHTWPITRNARGLSALEIAKREAKEIDGMAARLPLRLHVSGDCSTADCARIVSSACRRYTARRGQPVWTYTHSWRTVPRAAWNGVSVFASVESIKAARAALCRGYAVAMVTRTDSCGTVNGLELDPCPHRINDDIKCTDCEKCLHSEQYENTNRVITMEPIGSYKNVLQAKLAI